MINYNLNDWDFYFKYGGFPSNFHLNEKNIVNSILTIVDKSINQDMVLIKDINLSTRNFTSRLLNLLTLQKPGGLSQNKIGDFLDCPVSRVKTIINVIEKTGLIFHVEPYGSSTKRIRASWKYYFAFPSIRHCLALYQGINFNDSQAYEGILLENLVASLFFKLRNKGELNFNIYSDNMKGGADFLIQRSFENPIPLEVGRGKKKRKQVKKSMNEYKSNYGIIISNTTQNVEKRDDIIYIPYKTFSLL